jgi:hypothetical protein
MFLKDSCFTRLAIEALKRIQACDLSYRPEVLYQRFQKI